MIVLTTPASAEVCIDLVSTCAFDAAFEKAFGDLGVAPPSMKVLPHLLNDGDRPVARFTHYWALDEDAHRVLLKDRDRLDASVAVFSSLAKGKYCDDFNIAGFVSAGGVIEFWIEMYPKWETNHSSKSLKENIIVRIDTCEAN
jgi:hypothetical protein